MNSRITEMIFLLDKSNAEWSLNNLAIKLSVSERTIRNDLNEVNHLLKQNGMSQIKLKSGGILELPNSFSDSVPLLVADDFYN